MTTTATTVRTDDGLDLHVEVDDGPGPELVVVPGAGNSVNITRQSVVDDALLRLLERAESQRAA